MKHKNVIGPQVKRLRERAGLSAGELARKLTASGLKADAKMVSAWENQEREVSDIELLYLADAVNAELRELFANAE